MAIAFFYSFRKRKGDILEKAMRPAGIEPAPSGWEPEILPLYYERF